MDGRRSLLFVNGLLFVFMHCVIYYVEAVGADFFSYEYITTDDIIRVRCNGNCSMNNNLVNIIIYNSKTMKEMVVYNSGKIPVVFRQSVQDFSYYVGLGYYGEEPACYLELVLTNFKADSAFELRCNSSSSDVKGGIIAKSSPLIINKGVVKEEVKSLSSTIAIILIVAIIVLSLLAVLFMSLWIRGWCRYRNKTLYQTPPQSEINHPNVFSADVSSLYSFPKSPSKLNIRRESEFKYPATTGSVRRMNSRSEGNISSPRIGQPPLPPVPPPKPYWRDRTSARQMSTYCSVKVPYSYSQPQDAILEPEFSEDGDVTTGNNDTLQRFPQTFGTRNINHQKASFYSSAPVKSVDV